MSISNDSLLLLCRGSSHPLDAPSVSCPPQFSIAGFKTSAQPIQARKDGVMQNGSLSREQRKRSSDVWCYRWWESGRVDAAWLARDSRRVSLPQQPEPADADEDASRERQIVE